MSLMTPAYNPAQQRKARGASIPPPIGGLNARDALSNMDPRDALILNNWFPQPTYVEIRKGFTSFATLNGVTDPVESLMEWSGPTSHKLFAAADDSIYDITNGGSVASVAVGSLSNARWQYVNFSSAGGSFIFLVNGQDTPRNYDGSGWAVASISVSGSAVSASDFIYVTAHKSRLWLIPKNSRDAYYLGTSAISGAATLFPMAAEFKLGGKLIAAGTLSQDAGNGPDDFICFLTDNGEVAVYQGTDPAVANSWAIVGRYQVARPVPLRPLIQVGGDLFILTDDGVISMIKAINIDRAAIGKVALSDKINTLINQSVQSYRSNFGWQLFAYPKGNWAIVNVPVVENSSQFQYVMNTITGSWCTFTGMDANCWGLLTDTLFFGGNAGVIYQADNTYTDNGAGIACQLKTAFNYFGQRGTNKYVTMLRPVYRANGSPTIAVSVDMDFANNAPNSNLDIPQIPGSWDSGAWDNAMWTGDTPYIVVWRTVGGIGYCCAVRLNALSLGQAMQLNAFDVQWQSGGPL